MDNTYTTDIEEFDVIADTIFAPIYPMEAEAALQFYGKKEGHCLDLGCGGGHLGLAVAKQSQMKITALDINPVAVQRTLWGKNPSEEKTSTPIVSWCGKCCLKWGRNQKYSPF
jgi:2-polyprenyl-3-methyl-5-hydroxy-6-metoxy-1,4-benzoquinol methylase